KEPATIPRAAAATAIGRRRRPRALGEGLVTLAAHRSPRRIPAKRSPVNAVPPVVEQVEKSAVALPCSRATLSAIGSALVLLKHAECGAYQDNATSSIRTEALTTRFTVGLRSVFDMSSNRRLPHSARTVRKPPNGPAHAGQKRPRRRERREGQR